MRWPFSGVALAVGLVLLVVLLKTGAMSPKPDRSLPLLTHLIIAEFGFFLTAIGAGSALRGLIARFEPVAALTAAACGLLAVYFLWLGLRLWPGTGGFTT